MHSRHKFYTTAGLDGRDKSQLWYWAVLGSTGMYWAVLGFNWEFGDEGGEGGDLQHISKVIGFQKIYGLIGLYRRIQEKMCDVTLVT